MRFPQIIIDEIKQLSASLIQENEAYFHWTNSVPALLNTVGELNMGEPKRHRIIEKISWKH